MEMPRHTNVIPIDRGHEIRQEREEKIAAIEQNFALAVELFLSNGGTKREIKDWYFYTPRMITLLCREPEEVNMARMEIIKDLLDQNQGSINLSRDYNNTLRLSLYEAGDRCLREALDFYWQENDGKLRLPPSSV
jgi:hypothetical protein